MSAPGAARMNEERWQGVLRTSVFRRHVDRDSLRLSSSNSQAIGLYDNDRIFIPLDVNPSCILHDSAATYGRCEVIILYLSESKFLCLTDTFSDAFVNNVKWNSTRTISTREQCDTRI